MNINEEKATEIFEYLQNKLDCDFNTTRRQRRYVYAKKVFCKLAKETTYLTLDKIGSYVSIDHAGVINHLRTFHYIDEKYQKLYNQCILDLQLDVKMIERKKKKISDNKSIRLNDIMVQLRNLSENDLHEFEQYRLKPFLNIRKNSILTEN